MSNDFDPLKDVLPVSDQEKKALQTAASLIGSVWSVWGIVNSVKSVLTMLGVLSQSDLAATLRQEIDRLVQDFHGVVAALDKEQSMRAIADHLAGARTSHLELTESAPEDAATVGIDAAWDELRPLVLDGSLNTVLALGDPPYWKRVYFPELVYQKWPLRTGHPIPVVDPDLGLPSGLALPRTFGRRCTPCDARGTEEAARQ